MKYTKFLFGDLSTDSRDKRELNAALSCGYELGVVSRSPLSRSLPFQADVHQLDLDLPQPNMCRLKRYFLILKNDLRTINVLKRLKTDVLSCHDLYALQLGYAANLLRGQKHKVKLVYDAHEFEMGRNTDGARGKFASWYIQHAESFLMKRTSLNIMVNDSIAEETQRIHGLKNKPLVVRNITPRWELNTAEIKIQREKFIGTYKGITDPFILMYHGAVVTGRGIEELLQIVKINPHVAAVILGYGTENYINALQKKVSEYGIENRILFHDAVPYESLWRYVGAADVGLVNIQPTCRSYCYALPNKFFENIQSLTPVIASDFPELKKITIGYGIGEACDPKDIQVTNRIIEKMRTDKDVYCSYKENLKIAKEELCWENEKQILEKELTSLYAR